MNDLRSFIRYLLYILVPAFAAFATYQYLQGLLFEPYDPKKSAEVTIEITPNMTFRQICTLLEEKKLLKSARSLSLYARLRGGQKPIPVGEYKLAASMTPKQILTKLIRGDVYKRQLSVKAGHSIWQLGGLIESIGLLKESEFTPVLTNAELLARAGISAASFEGYLAPGEYAFGRPIKPEQIIWQMIERSERNWPVRFSEAAEKLRMTRHEVLTLASVLEKTAQNKEEREILSSIFHNRLSKGMKLQSDETVRYGLPGATGVITDKDRESVSPYNTYIHYGLPPGPITNPSVTSIEAALFPKESEFLFFTKDDKGGFQFLKTQQEFMAATEKMNDLPAPTEAKPEAKPAGKQ